MNEKKHMEPLPANLGSTIQLYLDGEIGTDAFAKLEALIKNNSAARSFYRCYANMDANLREISEEEQGAEVVVPMPANRRRLVGSLLQAVATFILGASVVYLTVGRGKASDTMTNVGPPLPKAASPFAPGVVKNGLAILTQAVGVEWAEGSEVHAAITGLAAETLKVKKGLLQVEFSSGAIVIIEGPAEFELINSMQAYCHRGKIRTIVPEAASGFMIGSNGIDVVGLGTEFALDFDGSAIGEVHVFDGEVEVHEKPGGKMHNLMAGNGLRIDGGVAEFLPLNEMGYVDAQRVAFLANAEADEHLANWLIYSEKLKAHADVLLYYSFDEKTTWSRKLRNVRKMTADPLHGAIVGCSWSEGRWDGKGSLEFKRAGDRVRIQIPGSHDEFSLMAWVRIDGFDRELNSLMLSDNWVPGGVHWQFTRDGALILGTRHATSKSSGHYQSEPVLNQSHLGRWIQLAVSYDSKSKLAAHYVNGKQVWQGTVANHYPITVPLGELGNWKNDQPTGINLRNLNGRMDEFVVFSRGLGELEMQALYQSGKPHSSS